MNKGKSSISFSKKNELSNLSKHMFGTNLEHIGDAIYRNGIWAEVIDNRKFCGPDTVSYTHLTLPAIVGV